MSDSTLASGELRSTPTATATATGTTDDAASGAARTIGSMAADSTTSTKSGKRNTGSGRKTSSPLPVSDLLNILQGILRDLQEAGLPVSAVQLPVSEDAPPRVAVLLEGVLFDTGKFTVASIEAAP